MEYIVGFKWVEPLLSGFPGSEGMFKHLLPSKGIPPIKGVSAPLKPPWSHFNCPEFIISATEIDVLKAFSRVS